MADFTEIASKFYRLSKGVEFKNGCSLNSIILFDCICYLAPDELIGNEADEDGGVSNANKKVKEIYGFKFNSAALSRNTTTLMELDLIRTLERSSDRNSVFIRYKDIMLTTIGHTVKKLMYQSNQNTQGN